MMQNAPFLHPGERAGMQRLDMLLMLGTLTMVSYAFYGWRPVLLMLCGVGAALLAETLGCLLMRRRPSIGDGSAAVTGALIVALLSPLAPYWLPAVAAFFAIWIVKLPFGGAGRNLFNPAAAGIAFVTVLFPQYMTVYPVSSLKMASLPLGDISGVATALSPAGQWMTGARVTLTWSDCLLGEFSGPLGTTAVTVIVACAIYLFVRRAAAPSTTVSFLVTCVLGLLVLGYGWQQSLLYVAATPLLFAAVFLLTDPVTSPHHTVGRILYGCVAALLVLLMRHFARYEETVCFALLLANAVTPYLDRAGYRLTVWLRLRLQREEAR